MQHAKGAKNNIFQNIKDTEIERIKGLTRDNVLREYAKDDKCSEFRSKAAAVVFMLKLPIESKAQIFARDIPSSKASSKTFFCAVPKRIFRKSVAALERGQADFYYEWIGPDMKILDTFTKCGIDLDMEGVPETRAFDEDIVWVAVYVNEAIAKQYKVVVQLEQWVVLKCDYDPVKKKFSAHLILHGYKWPTIEARKEFLNSIGLVEAFALRCPEAKTPLSIVDKGVFGVKFLRLFKSTKTGKDLPLWGAHLPGMMVPSDDFPFFLKSMTTYTVDCQLLEGGPAITASVASSSRDDTSPIADTADSTRQVQARFDDCQITTSFEIDPRPHRNDYAQYNVDQIRSLLDILDPKRFDDYDDWRNLCYALHDLGDDFKIVFVEASRRCTDKYDPQRASKLWDEAAKGPSNGKSITVGSLLYWAKLDDPDAFNKWRDLQIPSMALVNYDKGDRGLALIAHDALKDIIKLVPGAQKRTFYLFDQNECLWKRVFDGSVKMHMSFALDEVLNKIWNRLENQKESEEKDDEVKKLQTNIGVIAKQMYYIRTSHGLGNVLSLAAELFMDEAFEDKLDSVRHLLGVQNGVVDLRTGELRDRRPEDMIHKLAKAKYDPTTDIEWFNQVVKTIMAGSEEMTEFLQRFLGYAITGEVKEHVFGVFTNSG